MFSAKAPSSTTAQTVDSCPGSQNGSMKRTRVSPHAASRVRAQGGGGTGACVTVDVDIAREYSSDSAALDAAHV